MSELAVVGKSVPRKDGVVKVIGQAQFGGDLVAPGMLHGKVLRSPYAHARIVSIDTSRAKRLPGVRTVITGKDFPGIKFGFLPITRDQLPFATDKARYYGEAVAAIAAGDEDTAEEALDLIKVEYEELPALLSVQEALRPGAPLIHSDKPGNIAFTAKYHHGNVDRGFEECDYVKEEHLSSQRISHGFIEPHCMLASVEGDRVILQGTKQSPYITWRHLCRAMDLPLSKVRMLNPYVGGAYSGKHDPFDVDFAATKLALVTGRPVRVELTQDEVLGFGRQRHAKDCWIKLGAKKDGTLVALDTRAYFEGGAYTACAPINLLALGSGLLMPYRIPNARYDGAKVYTNRPPCGAVRGQARVIASYILEAVLTDLANDMGIDQVEIRRKNALLNNERNCAGVVFENFIFPEVADRLKQMMPWPDKQSEKKSFHGIGFATCAYGSGARTRGHWASAAVVKVTEDGGVNLVQGATELGQGSDTVLSQIVAEALGVRYEDVSVAEEDTDASVLEQGIFSCRTTVWAGNAARIAAEDARRQLAEVAATLLEADPNDIEFRLGNVYVKSDPRRSITFNEVVRKAYYEKGQPIYGRGTWAMDAGRVDWATAGEHFTPGRGVVCMAVEVSVDPETGKVRILNLWGAHDNGQPVNPAMLGGQLEGGSLAHLAQGVFEECLTDEHGKPLNADFFDYKMPTALDAPHFSGQPVIVHNPYGPFGAKGGGEDLSSCALAAVTNAITDAIGVRVPDLPLTPQKVLKALKQKNGQE
ncbi:MAG: molybdopterin-dependent oxidoreductase [Chloroflexi bacterium]|nr:molybdopterin-dependent oxidoreductase [Chloroflexota bacterium]